MPTVTRSHDEVSIHYEVHGTGDPTAHGWGFDRGIWDAAIPRVVRTRRVAALDLVLRQNLVRLAQEQRDPPLGPQGQDRGPGWK